VLSLGCPASWTFAGASRGSTRSRKAVRASRTLILVDVENVEKVINLSIINLPLS
jgi:hypothetical protein